MRKYLQQTLDFGFHKRTFSTSKRFAVIKKHNNRLVQGQGNIADEVEQTNRVPNVFSCVLLAVCRIVL